MEICKTYIDLLKKGDKESAVDYYLNHISTITRNIEDYLRSTDEMCYYYLVTFTLDPAKCNDYDVEEIEDYVSKQFTDRPSLKVRECYISREFHESGKPHWHVSVKTGKPLKKDRFHYFTQKYGNIDISKNKAQNLQDGINYISKSTTPTRLLGVEDLTPTPSTKGTKDYSRQLFLDFD